MRGLGAAALIMLLAPEALAAPPGAASAPTLPAAVEPAPPAVTPPRRSYEPVDFGRLVLRVPPGQPWLDVEVGLFCMVARTVSADGAQKEWKIPGARERFHAVFAREGLGPVPETSLFETPPEAATDLVLSGAVVYLREQICLPDVSQEQWAKGELHWIVEWQLYSRSQRQIVGTFRTSADKSIDRVQIGARAQLEEAAFTQTVQALATRPDLRDALAQKASQASEAVTPTGQTPLPLAGALAASPRGLGSEVDAVVLIATPRGHGSGFLVSSDGYVLTDAHVVDGQKAVKIRWSDGVETEGLVVRASPRRDVALIKTDPRGHAPLPLRRDLPLRGDTVFAIGAPEDAQLQGTLMRGIVSATRVIDGLDLIQSDVSVGHGMSGGPLIDEHGRVVGLTDWGLMNHGGTQGLNMFIPAGDALKFLALEPR